MMTQEIQEQFRIDGIILGAAGKKRFTVTGQGFGIDGKQNQKGIHHQRVNDSAFALFNRNRDRSTLETFQQPGNPFVQGFRFLFQLERFGIVLAGDL